LAISAALIATSSAQARVQSPEQVVQHHIEAFRAGDVDEMLKDYAPNAVAVVPIGTFSGIAQVRDMFVQYGKMDETNAHRTFVASMEMRPNGVVVENWTFNPGTLQQTTGSDIFVVRDGKILFHSMGPDTPCMATPVR